MNVYFAGGEDVDFIVVGSSGWIGADVRSGWARGSINFYADGTTTWPPSSYISNPASFGARSSLWLHSQLDLGLPTTANCILAALADSGGVGRILVRGTGTNGQLKISTRNAAGTITDLVTATTNFAAMLQSFDLFVNYSTSGQVQLYMNGALIADTGAGVNVTTDSATSLSYFYLSNHSSSQNTYWSEVIVADSDTRSAGLCLLNTSSAGNAQTWSGTASNVNQAQINDAYYISAASAGLIEEFTAAALPVGTFSVAGLAMSSRAMVGVSGPQHVEFVVRTGGADYTVGLWSPPVGAFANTQFNLPLNPATGLAWTTADLAAAGFNYGVESAA